MVSEGHKGAAVLADADAKAKDNTSPTARASCMQLVSEMHLSVYVAKFVCYSSCEVSACTTLGCHTLFAQAPEVPDAFQDLAKPCCCGVWRPIMFVHLCVYIWPHARLQPHLTSNPTHSTC